VLSPEWQQEVDDARRFIRACRADWQARPAHERLAAAAAAITCTVYA